MISLFAHDHTIVAFMKSLNWTMADFPHFSSMILIEVFLNDLLEPYFLLEYEGLKIDFSDMFECNVNFECWVESLLEYARSKWDFIDVMSICNPWESAVASIICYSLIALGVALLLGYIAYDRFMFKWHS